MVRDDGLYTLTATELGAAIARKDVEAVNLVEALRSRIERLDEAIHAWVCLDWEQALSTAKRRDAEARERSLRGPLHGVPVGIKDIYDVAGMVTAAGAAPFAHGRPRTDATAVARLREAGAIILGKTATTEFAYTDPAETRNPWNVAHTPGGSSSGSAAAVALSMVPLALGSQTVGSTLRPAAYCGVVGLKPTYGRITLRGVIPLASSLDHVGIFARRVEDAALVLLVLAGFDSEDPLSADVPTQNYVGAVRQNPQAPRLGLPRRYFFEEASPEVVAHVESVANLLARKGAYLEDVQLPSSFDRIHESGQRILKAEAAAYHRPQFASHRDQYGPNMRELLQQGLSLSAVDYVEAQNDRRRFGQEAASLFNRFDALLMPVTPTPAPRGLHSTGDSRFCAPWSFIGVPAISLPSGLTADTLPLGIQLVAGRFREVTLLAAAAWVQAALRIELIPPQS